jgi:ribosome-associated toxin RatA of RatAB toxin-antitoxin module
MPEATRTETWDAPIEKIYEVITNYENYPDFVDGCSGVNVLEFSEEGARVEFSLNLIKKFKYILTLKHEKPNRISWEFESGDIFKMNNGSWELTDLGDGKTEVRYGLEVAVKGFAPKSLVNTLTTKNLPVMLASYHKQCK